MSLFAKNVSLHRVQDASSSSYSPNPYNARDLDPQAPLRDDEIKISVSSINLDSSSARQLWEKSEGNEIEFLKEVIQITRERGKMHNPTTHSGGVLLGKIQALGRTREGEVSVGTPVVTLVSNTLVPLWVEKVLGFNRYTHQVEIEGFAILPPFARYTCVPGDLSLSVWRLGFKQPLWVPNSSNAIFNTSSGADFCLKRKIKR